VKASSPSALGRLLEEVSWGGNARAYRQGGRGLENVLAAEVFQALDFLPRRSFLGRIVQSLEGGAPETLGLLLQEIEQVRCSLLPGDVFLAAQPSLGEPALAVQPDGILDSPGVTCFLGARRIKPGAFQPEQLAREFLAVIQEAGAHRPLLLLVLPKAPPLPVRGHGQLTLREAVARWLPEVLARAEGEFPPCRELVARVEEVIAYVTWERVSQAVEAGLQDYSAADPSVRASIARLAQAIQQAIRWHASSTGQVTP
jgi:hypothetical protein